MAKHVDYKSELTISLKLRRRCIELFDECKELDDPAQLKAFASVNDLKLVIKCIPKSATLEYNILIGNLLTEKRSSSEPVLFDLLDALATQYKDWKEDLSSKCKELIKEITDELRGAENPEQEKDYQQLIKKTAPGDARGLDEAARQWIDEAGDNLDELALRITLSVFNGTTFEVIERAKDDLLQGLQQLAPGQSVKTSNSPSQPAPLMRRLEAAGARETEGKPPEWLRVIELEKPELAAAALSYVWQLNRETKWRQKLIEWLTSHVTRRSASVRTRAAVAAGWLALRDYRFVRDNLLAHWVQRDEPQFRIAVGMALGILIREESLAAEVQGLLRGWSESKESSERWAAMRAYIYVGAYCSPPGEVIARWREIAASEPVAVHLNIAGNDYVFNNSLHMSLMDAMVKFFSYVAQLPARDRRTLFEGILGELKKWLDDNKEDAWLGLFMFSVLGEMRSYSDENGGSESSPILLQLVEEQATHSDYRKQLAALFGLTLSNGRTIMEAQELLCRWLGWAKGMQSHAQLYEARIQTLFRDIIAADSSGRARGRLAACLRDCGRNQIAQRILAGL